MFRLRLLYKTAQASIMAPNDEVKDNRMDSTSDKQPSAAEKVFGVFELLEAILLCLSEDVDVQQEPVAQLFALQRINRTFEEHITSNKKLQSLMWLDNTELEQGDAEILAVASTARCSWLFQRLFNSPTKTGQMSLKLQELIAPEGHPGVLLPAFLRDEASWRRIVMPHLTRVGAVTIEVPVYAMFEDFPGGQGLAPDTDFKYRFSVTMKVYSRAPLYLVSGKYLGIFGRVWSLQRTWAKHIMCNSRRWSEGTLARMLRRVGGEPGGKVDVSPPARVKFWIKENESLV